MSKKKKEKQKEKEKNQKAPETMAMAAALPDDVKVIQVPAGAKVEVDVDVNEMSIPYTIALDGDVLIKSLVDRRKTIEGLALGKHRIGWAFAHILKGWKHTLVLIVDGKATVLEEMSEAAKESDHSVGVAFLVVV